MRVIADGVPLLSPRTGVGNYVFRLFGAMPTRSEGPEFAYYYGTHISRVLKGLPSAFYQGSRRVVRSLGRGYPLYRKALELSFDIQTRLREFDLYHETNYIPMPFDGPTVVTVFDLSFHTHPETHPSDRVEFMQKYFYPRLSRAARFLTISEFSKREMIRHLGLPPEKIAVTPLGVDPRFSPRRQTDTEAIRKKFGLGQKNYILSVGTLEPRKNLQTLLEVYAGFPRPFRQSHPLVLTGGGGWLMDDLGEKLRRFGIAEDVVVTGYVSEEDLPALYGGAGVFVYPSLYEGFGLPPLEAMACGSPVVTSDVASLPEVLGDAAVQVSPRDVPGLGEAIRNILEDEKLAARLRNAGPKRAAGFSWTRCAQLTRECYSEVLGPL